MPIRPNAARVKRVLWRQLTEFVHARRIPTPSRRLEPVLFRESQKCFSYRWQVSRLQNRLTALSELDLQCRSADSHWQSDLSAKWKSRSAQLARLSPELMGAPTSWGLTQRLKLTPPSRSFWKLRLSFPQPSSLASTVGGGAAWPDR